MADPNLTDSSLDQVTLDVPAAPQEEMIPQSKVSKIAAFNKREGHEKGYALGRQEALEEFKRQQAEQARGTPQAEPSRINEEEVQRLASKEFERQMMNLQANHMVNSFQSKVNALKSQYPDIEERLGDLDLANNSDLLLLHSQYPNAAEMLYHLASDPAKLANYENYKKYPGVLKKQLNDLSASIENNKSADSAPAYSEPLSQIKPTNIGKDRGAPSITDLRRRPEFRV